MSFLDEVAAGRTDVVFEFLAEGGSASAIQACAPTSSANPWPSPIRKPRVRGFPLGPHSRRMSAWD